MGNCFSYTDSNRNGRRDDDEEVIVVRHHDDPTRSLIGDNPLSAYTLLRRRHPRRQRPDVSEHMAAAALGHITRVHARHRAAMAAAAVAEINAMNRAIKESVLDALPVHKYVKKSGGSDDDDGCNNPPDECIICMIEFDKDDDIRMLPCMHSFHKDCVRQLEIGFGVSYRFDLECVDKWLLMKSFTCPYCMEPVDQSLKESTKVA